LRRTASNFSKMPVITRALSEIKEKYNVHEVLGSGSFGIVRRCTNRKTGEELAVKTIAKSKINDVETLKREISILQEVHHPHIIRLVDVYEDFESIHLVTELCTGGELYDRLLEKSESEEGHFEENDVAVMIRDVLDAIAYCHSINVVHRDLKPENFLLANEDEDAPIKIIDFGLSRHADPTFGVMESRVGTPYYVAPEVLQRHYTSKCDIWSIGVIVYILLCGFAPFAGDNDYETMYQIENYELEFPSPEWDDISHEAKDFVKSLLRKDPTHRPTAKEAMANPWIARFVKEEAEPLKEDEEVVAMPPLPSRKASVGDMPLPLQSKPRPSVGPLVPPPKPLTRISSTTIRLDGDKTTAFRKFLQNIKIKKAMGNLTRGLSSLEVKALGSIFQRVDRDGDGRIALQDIDKAVEMDPKFSGSMKEKLKELRDKLPMRRWQRLDVSALIDAAATSAESEEGKDNKEKDSARRQSADL